MVVKTLEKYCGRGPCTIAEDLAFEGDSYPAVVHCPLFFFLLGDLTSSVHPSYVNHRLFHLSTCRQVYVAIVYTSAIKQHQGPYSQLGLRLNLDFGLQDFPLENHKKTALKLL